MKRAPFITVIDPAGHTPELACFNAMVEYTGERMHYHLPALFGLGSLVASFPDPAGVIILGSSTSVHDAPDWQEPLFNWLWQRAQHQVPVLGICYGHQLIAHYLGGTVSFIDPKKEKKEKGFRQIQLMETKIEPTPSEGLMVVSHKEIVSRPPPDMTCFAHSSLYTYEGLAHRDLPIWTIQAHPEATPEFLANQSIEAPPSADAFMFGHQFVRAFTAFCTKRFFA